MSKFDEWFDGGPGLDLDSHNRDTVKRMMRKAWNAAIIHASHAVLTHDGGEEINGIMLICSTPVCVARGVEDLMVKDD